MEDQLLVMYRIARGCRGNVVELLEGRAERAERL